MKFELVDFYYIEPENRKVKFKDNIGTVHIYAIEAKLDIRGIHVQKCGRKIYFKFPYYQAIDPETGKRIFYPHLNFIDQNDKDELNRFLNVDVKNIINEKLALRE